MKKCILLAFALLLSTALWAQKDVTKFLGIPVDGNKTEFLQKLKKKGFTSNPVEPDVLEGEFNGQAVYIRVATNKNRVYRVAVTDKDNLGERDIQARFNRLCSQFKQNKKYAAGDAYPIPDNENISYEMHTHHKRYQASFYQLPDVIDSAEMIKLAFDYFFKKYSKEEIKAMTEEVQKDLDEFSRNYVHDIILKKCVWFMIAEDQGKYYINLFYDNEYNRANGEDL